MSFENQLLKVLLEDDYNDICFHYLHNQSNHTKVLLHIINEVLKEHPEYYLPLYYLINYPLQKWADEVRKDNQIGIDYLQKCLNESKGLKATGFFGITTHTGYRNHKESLLKTIEIMNQIEFVLAQEEYQMLKKIHLECSGESLFRINRYYKDVLIRYCVATFSCFSNYNYINQQKENEECFVYHNTDILLKNMKGLRKYALYGVGEEVDYLLIYNTLMNCIDSLNSFPYTSDLYIPVLAYAKGITETSTAKQMNRTRKYVRNKRIEGIDIVSQMIWGYAPKI